MGAIKGQNVIAPVVPFDTTDVHPSHEARYGKGGYRTVATLQERDAIPAPRLEAGMLVFVTDDGKAYQLGSDLATWTEFKSGDTLPAGNEGDVLTYASGEWVAAAPAGAFLPLAGGSMNSGAVVTLSNGTTDSEVGGWGFGVELTGGNSQYATIEYNAVTVQDGSSTTQLTPGHLSLPNGTQVAVGSLDNMTGGAHGISLICAVGFELNWQGGRIRSVQVGGDGTPQTIYSDSPIAFPGNGAANVTIDATGLTFSDGSTQTVAAETPTITIGTVTSGSPASATLSGTAPNYTLDLTLQPGDTGPQGEQGPQGNSGTSLSVSAGPTSDSYTVSDSNGGSTVVYAPAGPQGVGFTFTGAWVNQTRAYDTNYVCTYQGSSYVCLHFYDVNSADSVIPPPDNPTAWGLIAAKGDHGPPGVTSWNDLSDKPTLGTAASQDSSAFAAASHSHALSSLTQSGATSGQVVTWTGSAWAAATPSTYSLPDATTVSKGGVIVGAGLGVSSGTVSVTYGTTSGTACQGNDSRLSDARTPTGAAGGSLTGAYPNPTIAAGAFATTAEAVAGTSTTALLSPARGVDAVLGFGVFDLGWYVRVANGGSGSASGRAILMNSNTTANGFVGYSTWGSPGQQFWEQTDSVGIDFSKPKRFVIRIQRGAGSTNGVLRVAWGKSAGDTYPGTLARRGIGFEVRNLRFWLICHNGSSLTQVDTGVDYSAPCEMWCESNGSGTVTLYRNGTQIGTTTGGPTSADSSAQMVMSAEVANGGDASQNQWILQRYAFASLR